MKADRAAVALFIKRSLPDSELVELRPVARSFGGPASVYFARLAGGRQLAVKATGGPARGSEEASTLETEVAALRGLHALGCAVPEVVAVDEAAGLLATSWGGDETLDQAVSTKGASAVDAAVLLRAFFAIETGLDAIRTGLDPARIEAAATALRGETERYVEEIRPTVDEIAAASGRAAPATGPALSAVLEQILKGHWTFGNKDCNAANIVLGEASPVFVDFSVIGADWPERRLVGYLTTTGAGSPDGNFNSLLNDDVARRYDALAREFWQAENAGAVLDSHHLLMMLNAIRRLTYALRSPGKADSRKLLAAWPNAAERLDRLHALRRIRLWPNPAAENLREILG